jgi:hypothetical protein
MNVLDLICHRYFLSSRPASWKCLSFRANVWSPVDVTMIVKTSSAKCGVAGNQMESRIDRMLLRR